MGGYCLGRGNAENEWDKYALTDDCDHTRTDSVRMNEGTLWMHDWTGRKNTISTEENPLKGTNE